MGSKKVAGRTDKAGGWAIPAALVLAQAFLLSASVPGPQREAVKPGPKDKCPVCGMFVAKYPDFLAEILFKDGSHAVFDGAKDMFKFYFDLKKYAPEKGLDDIDAIYVTDYYHLTLIDARKAFYVLGSDVYGPMGKELVPLKSRAEAESFLADHQGRSILGFADITLPLIGGLDKVP
jgi:nitrous oxide reductase accessory protein NosL